MTDTSWELQKTLAAALDAGLSVPVFDYVPPETAYPYVVIGQEDADEMDSLSGERRMSRRVTLSVYSDQPGQREVKRILQGIVDAVHRQSLTLAAGRLVTIWVSSTRAVPDIDGRSYMGQAIIRAWTEQ